MQVVNIQLARGSPGDSGAGLGVESDMGNLTINESFPNFGSSGLYDVSQRQTTTPIHLFFHDACPGSGSLAYTNTYIHL